MAAFLRSSSPVADFASDHEFEAIRAVAVPSGHGPTATARRLTMLEIYPTRAVMRWRYDDPALARGVELKAAIGQLDHSELDELTAQI